MSRRACRIAGGLSLASLLWYASGMPPWRLSTESEPLRATLLFFFHIMGLLAGAASMIDDIWPEEERS